MDYIKVAYDEATKPFGEYPLQLAKYLAYRYDLKPGMKFLDNGCGRGEFLHAFEQCGLETYGADLSNFCPKASVVDLDSENLPFDDGYFDVVFSKSVIEHISNTQHYVSEMRRVLKSGGILILMCPDWESQYKVFYHDPTHIHPYTAQSLGTLLKMMDFKCVQSEKFIQLPCVWDNASNHWGGGYKY